MTLKEFNHSVDQWSDGLYRYALKWTGDVSSAEDVVQDCFERLWVNRDRVDATKIKSWLFTTAHHAMVDGSRKYKREQILEPGKLPEQSSPDTGYNDLQEVLHEALKRLPEVQKSVLLLRDYEGYSYQEIGEITGLSEPQVKVYIYRSRLHLRNYIGSLDLVV
ncbi:MAG: RNA polymerase sigma factor [Marinilabiliales bacterium]|nr:RNA polymerase sigma factor [Marinilabiliales bacterium]